MLGFGPIADGPIADVPQEATSGVTGTGAGTLPLTGTGVGAVAVAGAGAGTLPLTGTGAGAVRVTGAGAGDLPLTGSGAGTVGAGLQPEEPPPVVVRPTGAFVRAVDVLFADPFLSAEAVWRSAGLPAGSGVAVRVVANRQDATMRRAVGRIAVPALMLRVRVDEVPSARKDDLVEYRNALWRAKSDGVLDRNRLVWQVDLERAA